MKFLFIMLVSVLVMMGAVHGAHHHQPSTRTVAVTFDDLPAANELGGIEGLRDMTARLIKNITAQQVPVVGFVNEARIYKRGEIDARVAVLKMWLDAGLELGNHSFSHPSLNRTPLDKFQADVIRGETITTMLLREQNRPLRYFRHPFLHTGRDLATKKAFEEFLAARGYTIAPVTIDNTEWLFAKVYTEAKARGDREQMRRVSAEYVPYLASMFEFYEQLTRDLFGRDIPQVLLLHANELNADYFGAVAEMMKGRGYRFVTLEQALQDEAYRHQDNYIGAVGVSWLQRWSVTRGLGFRKEPYLPEYIRQFDSAASGSDFKSKKN